MDDCPARNPRAVAPTPILIEGVKCGLTTELGVSQGVSQQILTKLQISPAYLTGLGKVDVSMQSGFASAAKQG
jgi:hypothetical protein